MGKSNIDIDEVLAFTYDKWDLGKCSIRHYLVELGQRCWTENEGFSGKRPFGTSGWRWDVFGALVAGSFVDRIVEDDGSVLECDELAAETLLTKCFKRLQENHIPGAASHSIAGVSDLIDALRFYASASTYHAMEVLSDQPAGEFADDFSDDHGDEFYQRAMPGKLARETLKRLGVPW